MTWTPTFEKTERDLQNFYTKHVAFVKFVGPREDLDAFESAPHQVLTRFFSPILRDHLAATAIPSGKSGLDDLKVSFSKHCGCTKCPCSPGWNVTGSLYRGSWKWQRFDLTVDVTGFAEFARTDRKFAEKAARGWGTLIRRGIKRGYVYPSEAREAVQWAENALRLRKVSLRDHQ